MKWKPVDIIVGILAVTVAAGMLLTVYDVVVSEDPIAAQRLKNIDHVVGAVVGVVLVYVGSKIKDRDDKD